MTTLYCAECGGRFAPDDDHVWVDAETKTIGDRNKVDEYAFHPECWRELSENWSDPV